MSDAQITKVVQLVDRSVKRALRSKSADVEFVDHGTRQRWSLKGRIGPGEVILIIDSRESMHAVRLPLRSRIWIAARVLVDEESIVCTGLRAVNFERPEAMLVRALHGKIDTIYSHFHTSREGHPDLESMHCLLLLSCK